MLQVCSCGAAEVHVYVGGVGLQVHGCAAVGVCRYGTCCSRASVAGLAGVQECGGVGSRVYTCWCACV